MKHIVSLILVFVTITCYGQTRKKAFEINKRLGRGINFGQMFETPVVAENSNPWKSDYAQKVAELGFKHVRIPVRWEPSQRSSATAPYTINPIFINRIKQAVDSALNNGLLAIINMHHHNVFYANPIGQKARFLSQWKQISEFFKGYPDELLFEIMNEPRGMSAENWNVYTTDALNTIREDNAERIVLITPLHGGLRGLPDLQVPDDNFIILTVHYYNPFPFTHQGAGWISNSADWVGTEWNDSETEREIVRSDFAPLIQKSEEYNIPVHIGEFGVYNRADNLSREKYTTFITRYVETLNWSWAYWEFSDGFGIYNRKNNTYRQYLVDALLNNEMPQPSYYEGTPIYISDLTSSNDGWLLGNNSVASSTMSREDNGIKVTIANGGKSTWHVQVIKLNIKLEAGKKYRFSFKAKAASERTANAYLGMAVSPYSSYGLGTISLADTFSVFNVVFDMNVSNDKARMVFDIGGSTVDFFVKDIKLEEIVLVTPTSSRLFNKYRTTVYPNPVTDKIFINNLDDFSEISVLNLQGKQLVKKPLDSYLNTVGMEGFPAGLYLVNLRGDNKSQSFKILK